MERTHDFVDEESELEDSVRAFMARPELWRAAVGSSPRYFVCLRADGEHLFGLSKFCAFKDLDLADYVGGVRGETDGGTTQKHIARVCGRDWLPLEDCPKTTQKAFRIWFDGFYPGEHKLNQKMGLMVLKAKRGPAKRKEVPWSKEAEAGITRRTCRAACQADGHGGGGRGHRYGVRGRAAPGMWCSEAGQMHPAGIAVQRGCGVRHLQQVSKLGGALH